METPNSQSVGLVEAKSAKFNHLLQLESGGNLTNFELVYETYGALNNSKTNAILICHALSSDHHAAGITSAKDKIGEEGKLGWWDIMIGPGKPIDTNKFFIVCCNNLAGCSGSTGPSSINPESGKPYGTDFPIVTVKDWVDSQALLADHLDIKPVSYTHLTLPTILLV